MTEKPIIHLGFSFDSGYVDPFFVLLTSVFYHNSHCQIVIHAIASELAVQEKQRLVNYITKKGGEVYFYDFDNNLFEGLNMPLSGHLAIPAYYRLFFAQLLPSSVKRIIYLDIDTLVVGDLLPLFNIANGTYPIAAVSDDWMPARPELGVTKTGDYFNSGVVLIDIVKWKEKKVTERALDAIRAHPAEVFRFADQDALNLVLACDWYKLHLGYNLTSVHCPETRDKRVLEFYLADKIVIHFSGPKPWDFLTKCTHVYKYKWFEYYSLSPVKTMTKYFDVSLSTGFIKKIFHKYLLNAYLNYPLLGKIKRTVLPNTKV